MSSQPKTFTEISGDEELCKHCSWTDESHSPGSVCEGGWCAEAYESYLEDFEEEK